MSAAASRCLRGLLPRSVAASRFVMADRRPAVPGPWFLPAMTLRTSAALGAEPRKKKKVDPRLEHSLRERLKKKLKKLEKVRQEFIPIEDFITPLKWMDESRVRSTPQLSFDESEERAMMLKEWSQFKKEQHMAEERAVELALEAQMEALRELKLESEELYQAAMQPDLLLFPFTHEGPAHTPAKPAYEAPSGKYNDITRVYTQK